MLIWQKWSQAEPYQQCHGMALVSVQVRPGSIIDDLAEMEPGYLAKQNKEMRRLLVDCRKELYMVS